ncbi:PREDICTED: putative ammonium transporter 1 [Branchiostoma belcheri]|uniref:Ammonium transporter n=1 Tax=Branchiostoma belcheri TaxID=7741 RepID=A0A6P4Z5B1_BRABE|nr:PREDICTED: putative ammonium transporter 1 [Branchiostoma belcheri]
MASRNLTTVEALAVLQKNSDQLFLVVTGLFVFFMQAGFGFREAGSVRSKNTTNILIRTMLNVFISGIAYWGVGYAFAYGTPSNFFLGHSNFFLSLPVVDVTHARWFFQFTLAATCVTIVSRALTERAEFAACLVYAMLISGFLYPVVSHWAWDPAGWLRIGAKDPGLVFPNFSRPLFQDFAGSGVVHMTGGAIALVGAIMVGRRIGRFEGRRAVRIPEHNVPLVSLGTFMMFLGLLAFNVGAQGAISRSGDGEAVSVITVNTVISAAMGGLVAMLMKRVGILGKPNWTYLSAANGALTGMVSVAAGCDVVYTWGALVIGTVAGLTYCVWSRLLQALRIDDPVDTIAVHLGGGFWGLVAAPILSRNGIIQEVSTMNLKLFGWNLAGAVAIFGWGVVTAVVIFGIMKCFGALRVDGEVEMQGLDVPKHDEPAYPQDGYNNGWRQQGTLDRKYAGVNNDGFISAAVPASKLAVPEKPRGSAPMMSTPAIYDDVPYIREMQMSGRAPRDPRDMTLSRDPRVMTVSRDPRVMTLSRDPRDSASYYVSQPYF